MDRHQQRIGALDQWQATKILDHRCTVHSLRTLLMEDHEGNLWVGTETGGLHILRDQRFRSLGKREGLSSDATTTVVEGATDKLWVGTSGGGLNALRLGVSQSG